MASHSIKLVQKIPASLDEVWNFFSNPANLQTITPAEMKFRVISRHHGDTIYAGQIIEYKVSPLFGVPLYWMTEITHVKPKDFFADEQRKGPYRMWHHQHHFREISGGVEMTDIVHYKSPGWVLEGILNKFLVRGQLNKVFNFRMAKVEEVFGKWNGESPSLVIY
jgi:ligand-binding SRPBCC domain-containing protein